MTLGEKLKELRLALNLSQPELAQAAAIEQSYLSKLENDKSLPSNEVLRQLLAALKVDLSVLLSCPKLKNELTRLKHIPDVEAFLSQHQQLSVMLQRRWWYISTALIVLAVTLFYIGQNERLFNQKLYQYESKGVVLAGEQEDIFNNWRSLVPRDMSADEIQHTRIKILQRHETDTLLLVDYRGEAFVKDVPEGRRYYNYLGVRQNENNINAGFRIVGVLLFSMGIMGFVLERKVFKHAH